MFRQSSAQPDDGQGGPGPSAHQDGGPGKRERVHLKGDSRIRGQINRDLILKSGGGDTRGDGGSGVVGAVDHQPGSHQQGQRGIHVVRNLIGARLGHGEHRVAGIGGNIGGQNLGCLLYTSPSPRDS